MALCRKSQKAHLYLIDDLLDHVAWWNLHGQRQRRRRIGRDHSDGRRTWKEIETSLKLSSV